MNLVSKTVEIGTAKVSAMFTREMIRDIQRLSGMINQYRKSSINKILNLCKQSTNL